MFDLSRKQQEVLLTLGRFARSEGRMPSVRELAEQLGLAAATTQQHLSALARKGYVRAQGRAYGLEILPKAWTCIQTAESPPQSGPVSVPVVGNIAAGFPIEAIEESREQLLLPRQLACPRDFLLRVQGSSLLGDGIFDGDLVLIRPQASIEQGDIAVALLPDGSATLKHVHFQADAVLLVSSNPDYPALRLPSVTLRGRMVGLWRSL